MFIQTESTPNPATLKFLPGQTVLEMGTADFPAPEAASASPLATRLFAVEGVTGVFFGTDFVTITKADGIEWDHLLDSRVRPAVAQDGGDITFHGFERGVVYLHMPGACAGCPSSTLTLKMGIENLLRHYIPEVTEVRPVA